MSHKTSWQQLRFAIILMLLFAFIGGCIFSAGESRSSHYQHYLRVLWGVFGLIAGAITGVAIAVFVIRRTPSGKERRYDVVATAVLCVIMASWALQAAFATIQQ